MVVKREWPGGASSRATEVTVGRLEYGGMSVPRCACRNIAIPIVSCCHAHQAQVLEELNVE